MNSRKPLNREAAKHHPEQTFERPLEVIEETLLTRGEKLATLERWRRSILAQLGATGEGMRTHGVSVELAATLEEIEEAKRRLTPG